MKSESSVILARMPLFSLNIVRELYALKTSHELETFLRDLLKDPEVAEALHSVNPKFNEQLQVSAKWTDKEVQTLANYVLRMSYRPTPLGLVAGVARLDKGPRNSFLNNEEMKLERFTEPSPPEFAVTLKQIRKSPEKFSFLTNPNSLLKGSTCWFIDWKQKDGHRSYFRSKAVLEKEGQELLRFCQSPRIFSELLQHFDVRKADSEDFLRFLEEFVSARLLEFDAFPSLVQGKKAAPAKDGSSNGAFTQVKITLPENEIAESQVNALEKISLGLYRISKVWNDRFSPWFLSLKNEFRKNYQARYVPLLDFLLLHQPETDERLEDDPVDSPTSKRWLELLSEAASLGKKELELTEELMNALEIPAPPETRGHPDPAYSMIYSLGKEKGEYRGKYVFGVQGWEGVRGYSRFSRLHPEIRFPKLPENDDGKIFVDLEFYPGDVATGISKREQSINSFIRISHLKADSSRVYIDLSEIEVSLQNDLFVLRWRSQGKEIIPVMTTAHIVHAHGHPIFRFFGFIAAESKKTFLDVPWLPDALTYIPAVTYRGYQLSSRRWKMRSEILWSVAADRKLREKLGIPRWIVVREQDNILPFDLESPVTPFLLRKYQANRPLKVEEEWHLTQAAQVKVAGKDYSQEILLQWKAPPPLRVSPVPVIAPPVRMSSPADKIQAFHFYLPKELLDSYLLEVLLPLARRLKKAGKISAFYFIKYAHPSPHLRFRLFGRTKASLWEEFFLKALDKGNAFLIHEAVQSPFELELETYGGREGLNIYHRLSSIFSEHYSSYSTLRSGLSRSGHRVYGDPVDVAYLVLLYLRLFEVKPFSGFVEQSLLPVTVSEIKIGTSHFRKFHHDLLENDALSGYVEGVLKKLSPELNQLDKNFASGRIKISRNSFLQRIIHMEVFRISNGTPDFLEPVSLNVAKKVLR